MTVKNTLANLVKVKPLAKEILSFNEANTAVKSFKVWINFKGKHYT